MEDDIDIVRKHYDEAVEREWERFTRHPFEFEHTKRMLARYIKPGDRVLDIGGGPGRYSLHLAEMGCEVTLVDLSPENVRFASEKAKERNVDITAIEGNACEVNRLVGGEFDHVLLMGPMYHLTNECDRIKAVEAALSRLKVGGKLYVSYILMFGGMIYLMKFAPELILAEGEQVFIDCVIKDDSYGGDAFTRAYFVSLGDILPFMEGFPLKKLHLFAQEGIMAPCEQSFLTQTEEVKNRWLTVSEQLCEREDLMGFTEHVMYIGQKQEK